MVSSQLDPSLITVYTITIHRSYLTQISYHFKNAVVHTQYFYTGNEVQAEWTPDFTGYTFNCWRDDDEEQYLTQTLWSPLDLYADATANSYKVTLDVNDGDSLNQTQYSVSYDSEFTLPTPTREGHTFLGWYNGEEEITDGTNTNIKAWNIADDVQLQAHWQINDYTLGVDVSDATCGSVQGGGTFTYDSSITLTATTNRGYIFLGWYEGESLVSDELVYTFDMPAKSTTYTATWRVDEPLSSIEFTSTPTTCKITGVKDSAVTDIVVPNYVTSIGSGAFRGCNSLESITLPFVGGNTGLNDTTHFGYIFGASSYSYNNSYVPSSLKKVVITGGISIGKYAFYRCSNLTDITISSTVKSIGSAAFDNCSSLENVYYGGTLEMWCGISFDDSYSSPMKNANHFYMKQNGDWQELTEMIIPESVSEIKYYTFHGFDNVTSVTIPSTVTSIEYGAFWGCSKLTIFCEAASRPQGWSGSWNADRPVVWNCCGVTTVEGVVYGLHPDNTATVGNTTDNLPTQVTIPQTIDFDGKQYTVTNVGERAFYNCSSLMEIEIPNSVTSIGDNAFCGCNSLESITLPFVGQNSDGSGATHFGYIFGAKDYEANETSVPTSLQKVVITDVTSIGDYVFRFCSSLKSIVIPSTVTSIGSSAFDNCSSLENVYYSGIIDDWCRITFSNGWGNPLNYTDNFYIMQGENLQKVTTLEIPESVTEIGDYQFYGFKILDVTIPNSITKIGSYAFYECSALKNVYYGGTIEDWCEISFDGSHSSPMEYANHFYMKQNGDWQELTEMVIPESVTEIGYYQFCGFKILSVTVPNSITKIGSGAFYNCSALKNVYYGGTIEDWCLIEFGGDADLIPYAGHFFMKQNGDWQELTGEIEIPNGVEKIGDYQFHGFNNMTSITIPSTVTSIGYGAFSDCRNLQTITFESDSQLQSIGNSAFADCYQLKSIIIPNMVTSIGDDAFLYCSELKFILIPISVTSIGYGTFNGCDNLTIYCEATSRPSGWDIHWNPDNRPVVGGYKNQ